jgi:hypothetical protein
LPFAPKMVEPLRREALLSRIARIPRIDENVSVDETRAGHKVLRASDKAVAVP